MRPRGAAHPTIVLIPEHDPHLLSFEQTIIGRSLIALQTQMRRASLWRSYRLRACFALAAIVIFSLWVYAGSRREPMLEGRPVRELIRQARSADSEAATIFRRNGAQSVPGLVTIMGSRPSLSARVAEQLKQKQPDFVPAAQPHSEVDVSEGG